VKGFFNQSRLRGRRAKRRRGEGKEELGWEG
jgi:hypothetical protein